MTALTVSRSLTAEQATGVLAIIDTVTDFDGRRPISDDTALRLTGDLTDEPVYHVLAEHDGDLAGYAILTPTSGPHEMVAEIAVAPSARHHHLGHALVAKLTELAPGKATTLWAHGHEAPAAALAESMGFRRSRVLHQLRRPLAGLPERPWPTGYTLRTYRPTDDAAVLAVNAAAFVDLPDQASWTLDDLAARRAQEWFDPDGFFLAQAPDHLAGFHWTKRHPGNLGEIYVLAVAPTDQGRGLAAALAVRGLEYLAAQGCTDAMLYVDETNQSALRLYERLGFTAYDVSVLYLQT